MSVAFRRDRDEEHLEPKFELPVPVGPNLVTARGLALIELQVARLESDLTAAKDAALIGAIKRDLRYWQTRRITAELAPIPVGDKVEFGVEAFILLRSKPRTFRIVGDDEADPAAGMISFKSPLSRAMLGAELGEALAFAGVTEAIQILDIKVLDEPPLGNLP